MYDVLGSITTTWWLCMYPHRHAGKGLSGWGESRKKALGPSWDTGEWEAWEAALSRLPISSCHGQFLVTCWILMRCGASCPGTELRDIKLLRCSLELAPQQPSVLQLMLQSSGPFCFSAVLFDIQDKDRGAAGIFGYLFFHYLWKACELTGGSLYFYQWNCLLRRWSCLVFALHEILLSSPKSSVSPSSKPLLWFCWVLKLCFQMTTFYYLSFNKPSMLHRI